MCDETAEVSDTQTMAGSPGKQAHISRADELRAKIAKAHADVDTVRSQIAQLQRQIQTAVVEPRKCTTPNSTFHNHNDASMPEGHDNDITDQRALGQARDTVARYKESVTKFNDLRDAALGLLGLIAEKEGRTLRDVLEERGIEDDD